jgi:uncharacterized membrane protein
MVWPGSVIALAALAALAVALALKPWRGLSAAGPPWPWLAWCALLPLSWAADRLGAMPMAQPLPGACLLMLMAGWPLATLAFVPVALASAWLGELSAVEALQRALWLGLAPATVALGLGSAVRRWLPHHLFVYILGRAFIATALANTVAGAAHALSQPLPHGLALEDLLLARGLAGWGDAVVTGMIVAIFVAFRPDWLATYTDRLYLPNDLPARHGDSP